MVLANGLTSEPFAITQSIKQGGIMSMMNFCIYLFDIHQFVDEESSHGLIVDDIYVGSPTLADDIMIMSPTKSGLDVMMGQALIYSKLWHLRFSSKKSKCMVFGESKTSNNKNRRSRVFRMDDDIIEEVTHYCHVGITLSATGNSSERTNNMCVKSNNLICAMTGIGVKHFGINPLVCNFLWNRICIASMLHGSELWNDITAGEMKQLERAQCRALKKFQGMPIRTHGVIVRGMVHQPPIQSLIDIKKLMFLHKLMNMADCIHKQLFLKRAFEYIMGRNITGFIADIWTITHKYEIAHYMKRYLCGGTMPNKMQWKALVRDRVDEYNVRHYMEYADSMLYTHVVGSRGQGTILYRIAKRNPLCARSLIAMAKLLTIPDERGTCACCGLDFDSIVNHVIHRCTYLIDLRNSLWDTIIDILDVHSSVELFNMDDEAITQVLLAKHWRRLSEQDKRDKFYCMVSSKLLPMITSISKTYHWQRM